MFSLFFFFHFFPFLASVAYCPLRDRLCFSTSHWFPLVCVLFSTLIAGFSLICVLFSLPFSSLFGSPCMSSIFFSPFPFFDSCGSLSATGWEMPFFFVVVVLPPFFRLIFFFLPESFFNHIVHYGIGHAFLLHAGFALVIALSSPLLSLSVSPYPSPFFRLFRFFT